MINEKYGIAICETLHYLKGINQNDLNKIPGKFMEFLNNNCLKDYKCDFDYSKPLKDLKISDEARGLIAMICMNYWCVSNEQKDKFKKHLIENEIKFQEDLREKYNPNDIFKNRNITTKDNDISQEIQEQLKEEYNRNLPLEVQKQNIFQRLLRFIKKLIHK